jgi:hypothetical protein
VHHPSIPVEGVACRDRVDVPVNRCEDDNSERTPIMKTLSLAKAVAYAVAIGISTASTANAILLTVGDTSYLGSIYNGIPASVDNELGWVNQLKDLALGSTNVPSTDPVGELLTRSLNDFGHLPDATKHLKDDVPPLDIVALLGSKYTIGKYGGGQTGISHVWYVGGLAEGTVIDLQSSVDSGALSHQSLLGVPDGGSTVLILGLGIVGLSLFRRRFA